LRGQVTQEGEAFFGQGATAVARNRIGSREQLVKHPRPFKPAKERESLDDGKGTYVTQKIAKRSVFSAEMQGRTHKEIDHKTTVMLLTT
jgi:hypothetical protein